MKQSKQTAKSEWHPQLLLMV